MHGSTKACSDARPTKAQTPVIETKKEQRSAGSRSLRKVISSGSSMSLVFCRCRKTQSRVTPDRNCRLTAALEPRSVSSWSTIRLTCSRSADSSVSNDFGWTPAASAAASVAPAPCAREAAWRRRGMSAYREGHGHLREVGRGRSTCESETARIHCATCMVETQRNRQLGRPLAPELQPLGAI